MLAVAGSVYAQTGQIRIPRIELMPNEPAPFNVRDWREVAVRYDSFVYDLNKTGQYLPLVFTAPAGHNYPQNPTFGLSTYVGSNNPRASEGINVLPSLVGASLAGIDKSSSMGRNWVLMSQDFFNKNNGELIYLNNPGGRSGHDWWYDLMPNVFFYQLYHLYPGIGDSDYQFVTVADRFAEAVRAMGGGDAPWQKAKMDYRAWNFKDKTPNATGVIEPEAAGAYAWVLYSAYSRTGNPEYLRAAEWSLEFLNEWHTNPSYELQLPYGTYTAARMNAEIGTDYDIEQLVNWSFDRGPLRGWGTIVGKWGGFDVSGLVGEANDNGNDYAFQLNGVQQAAALVPMVRYDKRFARSIGKWVLNLANATRLFFPGFLPGFLQDATQWSEAHDPDRVMGYEAMREKFDNKSPYSTGDALQGNWAATNLALYGTSSIGYLGGLMQKTDTDKILQLDLLKTDFFGGEAYPTYLLFNPYASARTVSVEAGDQPVDIYEALSETFIARDVTGPAAITIPGDEAVIIVLAPAGGEVRYDLNRMLIDDVVVDYGQSAQAYRYPPRIKGFAAAKPQIETGDSTAVYATAFDKDSDDLTYTWSTSTGTISGSGATVEWHAPEAEGAAEITVYVEDPEGQKDSAVLTLDIVAEINVAPEILDLQKEYTYIHPSGQVAFTCAARDRNGDPITYTWSASAGTIEGSGAEITWNAPATEGIFTISVRVSDDKGLVNAESTTLLVRDFDPDQRMDLIAYYPFSGDARDASGNGLHGTVSGARLTEDAQGKPSSAYYFNGINHHISVANNPLLNFQEAITLSCWFSAASLPERESFLLSHGSWQNRWKVSITPERQLRWTVQNTAGTTRDLDSHTLIGRDSFYHMSVSFDGSYMMMYINGELDSYRELTGSMKQSAVALLIAQMLPGESNYNFQGTMDEVRIYASALNPAQVRRLYDDLISSRTDEETASARFILLSPNPAGNTLQISLNDRSALRGRADIYTPDGKLVLSRSMSGEHIITLDISAWRPGMYFIVQRAGETAMRSVFIKS